MAARNPLVLIAGQMRELPATDSIVSLVSKYSITGPVVVNTGSVKWYPEKACVAVAVYLSLGAAGGVDTIIDVKKNGSSIMGGSYPTVTAGATKSNVVTIAEALAITDYLTVDVTQGGGDDATICIVYN